MRGYRHRGRDYSDRHGEPEEVRRAREFLLHKLKLRKYRYPPGRDTEDGNREVNRQEDFRECRKFVETLRRRVWRMQVSFRSHLSVYLGVNGFLFILNMLTSSSYPWFLFPAGGWGLGVLFNYASLRRQRKVLWEMEQLPAMSAPVLQEFRDLKGAENRSSSTVVVFGGITAYLGMVNLITSGLQVPWFLIPAGIMGAVFLNRRAVMKGRLAEWRDDFEKNLRRVSGDSAYPHTGRSPAVTGYEQEAQGIVDAVLTRLEHIKDVRQIPGEISDVLETCLEQVKLLSTQAEEIDIIMGEIPRRELEEDRRRLEEKLNSGVSDSLRQEYQRSITEIGQHEQAYRELEEQRELIDLRIKSAINSLKKLRLDIARINSIAQVSTASNFNEIKRQSEELSQYIRDLVEGYQEADRIGDRVNEEMNE